ncbi:MAG: heme-binding protein [Actinomycetes bacterium]
MTEQQVYRVERTVGDLEVRHYEPCVVAEVSIDGSFESAGSKGFRPLIGFISGRNESETKVAMTAPVIQDVPNGRTDENSYTVSFVMPAGATRESLPIPTDAKVVLRTVSEHNAVAVRFSGRWSRSAFDKQIERLRQVAADNGITLVGDPRFARYDPPWTPWFSRRNEVIWTIAD